MASITLEHINKTLEVQTTVIGSVKDAILRQLQLAERQALDAEEARRESAAVLARKGSRTSRGSSSSGGGSGGGFSVLPLAGLQLPAIAALTASIAGFDDAIKSVGIIRALDAIKKSFGPDGKIIRLINTIDDLRIFASVRALEIADQIKDFKNLKLPKITLPDFPEGWGKLRLPSMDLIPKISFNIPEAWGKIQLPRLVDLGLPKITLSIPEGWGKLKLPDFPSTGDLFGSISKVIGGLPAGPGMPGTGLLGFIGAIADGLSKIPLLGTVLKTITRPFTQVILSVIDFAMGFYEGFTEESSKDLKDKLMAGLEGGVLGVIKGITDAIDLVFVDLPAWILGKLGFEGVAENLKQFSLTALVDPIWEGIKGTFKFAFDPVYRQQKIDEFRDKFDMVGMIGRFFSNLYQSTLEFLGLADNVDELKAQLADLEAKGDSIPPRYIGSKNTILNAREQKKYELRKKIAELEGTSFTEEEPVASTLSLQRRIDDYNKQYGDAILPDPMKFALTAEDLKQAQDWLAKHERQPLVIIQEGDTVNSNNVSNNSSSHPLFKPKKSPINSTATTKALLSHPLVRRGK